MPFAKGQSGNPAGRPAGSRNRFNREMDEVLAANGPELIDKIITHAHAANPAAMRLCFDRLAPVGKNRPSGVSLPPVDTPDYTMAALARIQRALEAREITSDEGMRLLGFVERTTRILASQAVAELDFVQRLARCEEALQLDAGKPATPEESMPSEATPSPAPQAAEAAIVNNNVETMDALEAEARATVATTPAEPPPVAKNTEYPLVAAALDKAVQAACPSRGRDCVKERLMSSTSPSALLAGFDPANAGPVMAARAPNARRAA
jgi:hypothetical protein